MKIFSFTVPCYNSQDYMSRCIDSLLVGGEDVEIIIVDDGSEDHGLQICYDLAKNDSRVRIVHQENRGLAGARFTGLKNSKTEYVTFVDADDFIAKKSYSKAIEYMKQDVDIICFNITRYFSNEYIVLNKSRYLPQLYKKKNIEEEI